MCIYKKSPAHRKYLYVFGINKQLVIAWRKAINRSCWQIRDKDNLLSWESSRSNWLIRNECWSPVILSMVQTPYWCVHWDLDWYPILRYNLPPLAWVYPNPHWSSHLSTLFIMPHESSLMSYACIPRQNAWGDCVYTCQGHSHPKLSATEGCTTL